MSVIRMFILRVAKEGVSRLGTITGEVRESNALMGVRSLFNKFPTDAAPARPTTESRPQTDRLHLNVLLIWITFIFFNKIKVVKDIMKLKILNEIFKKV